MVAKKQIKLTLVRSLIGRLPNHKACANSLGLRKMGQSVVVVDNPAVRGMINKVSYLLLIEEV